MKFTAYKEAAIDYDGTEIKEFKKEFDSPFIPVSGLSRYCYVIYKGFFGNYKSNGGQIFTLPVANLVCDPLNIPI